MPSNKLNCYLQQVLEIFRIFSYLLISFKACFLTCKILLHFLGFKLALVQLFVERYRERNLVKAAKLIKEAAKNGARVVALPVCIS